MAYNTYWQTNMRKEYFLTVSRGLASGTIQGLRTQYFFPTGTTFA